MGVWLGINGGVINGTASQDALQAEIDALTEEYNAKMDDCTARIADAEAQRDVLEALSMELRELYYPHKYDHTNGGKFVEADTAEIADLVQRCQDAGIDASALVQHVCGDETDVFYEDAEDVDDAIIYKYRELRTVIVELEVEMDRAQGELSRQIEELIQAAREAQ